MMAQMMHMRRFAFIIVLSVLSLGHNQFALAQSVSIDPVELAYARLNVIDLLENEPRLPLPVKQRRDLLLAYYQDQDRPLLWVGDARAEALVTRMERAELDGLSPQDYPIAQLTQLVTAVAQADARGRAVIELHLSAAFLEYVSDLAVGRVLPARIDPNFFLQERRIDGGAMLAALAINDDFDLFVSAQAPRSADYQALQLALSEHRALAANGGWPSVPFGETLKPGMSDPRVTSLRARLAITDGAQLFEEPEANQFYDEGLKLTVERFQTRHGLDVDGAVGPATIAALNVPVEQRIDSILIAMERWRWMPSDLGQQHIMVNIAGYELRRVNNGVIEELMNVVVGKPYTRTPVFSDRIRYLEINPYWNVPSSIALGEQLAQLQSDPSRLAASGFEAVRGDEVYDLRSINWSQYSSSNFPFLIRQRPGPNNALGRVKFMFPNEHNVYLHDTPARSLFSRSDRAFSHGCVRLARPLDLTEQVLAVGGVPGWDQQRIDQVLASGERTVVNLEQPLPVHITYLTAWVQDGIPQFRTDIYEHDQKLIAALQGNQIDW